MKLYIPFAAAAALLISCHSCEDNTSQTIIVPPHQEQTDTSSHDTPVKPDKPKPQEPMPEPASVENDMLFAIWGNTNTRYAQNEKAETPEPFFKYSAWRNEKVNAEAVLWAKTNLSNVTLTMSDLIGDEGVIESSAATISFMGYVIGDIVNKNWYGDCACREIGQYPTILVADRLDKDPSVNINANSTQPVWVSVKVPKGTKAGVYKGTVDVNADGMETLSLPVWLKVADYDLPDPKDWKFFLDIHTDSYELGKYAGAVTWTTPHFNAARPYLEMLGNAGQKCIYTVIAGHPTLSMVTKTKYADGTWEYDYRNFDRWVEMAMECGITKTINCYGVVPTAYKFDYFDKTQNKTVYIYDETSTQEYVDYWRPFLLDFREHLKEKGWFDKAYLAFDERKEEQLLPAFEMINAIVPDFKIWHTGVYFESVEKESDGICIEFNKSYPDGKIAERNDKGLITLYYVACGQRYPNVFMDCPLAEGEWFGWVALARDLTGFLRWGFNKWDNEDALHDGRAQAAPAGDRFMVYPGARSGVRFEKIIEGVQDYEKAVILRDKWTAEGNTAKLSELNAALARFTYTEIPRHGSEPALHQAKTALE